MTKRQPGNSPRFSSYFYNPITYVGAFLSGTAFFLECFLFAVDILAHGRNLYLGIITYVLLPPFLLFGLALIPVGAFRRRHRIKIGLESSDIHLYRIDLTNPHHLNMLAVFVTGTVILIAMSAVGAYKGFQYTESVQFCGVLCHTAMNPEYTAHANSPHARITCAQCHVGDGADSYLRSKMTGARQMLQYMTNTYHHPIPTPVKGLRPADQICEQCHWPGKLYGTLDLKRDYFLTQGDVPKWHMRMLLNIGGGEHKSYGVHAHMNVDHDVYYAAEDDKRENITWVKSVDKAGKETVFVAPGSKYEAQPPPAGVVRKMDCVDCHNRPTHRFSPPNRLVNEAMQDESIDPAIPSIKEKGVEALSAQYATAQEASERIRASLHEFYKKNQPDFYKDNQAKIDHAADTLISMYSKNMFPEMKARWDSFPDHAGHLMTPGCFRCHDGEHKSGDGKVITKNCNACHTIIEQGPAGATEKNDQGLEFKHPAGGDEWKEINCSDCHAAT